MLVVPGISYTNKVSLVHDWKEGSDVKIHLK